MTQKTPSCLRLAIPLADGSIGLQNILHIGLACAKQVKKMGGNAKCFSVQDFVIVEMSKVSRHDVEAMVDSLGESPSMSEANLNLLLEERDAPEMNIESPEILPGEIAIERMTKKFLSRLPNGAIIVGNELRNGIPNFCCRLEEGQDRNRIWARVVDAGADQRTCHVYWNPRDVAVIHGVNPDVEWS